MRPRLSLASRVLSGVFLLALATFLIIIGQRLPSQSPSKDSTDDNAVQLTDQGRQIFRFDTFGDEAFWGDTLKLHQAIEGSGLGGVGSGVSPLTALSVGLKVDVDSLPRNVLD